MFFSSGATTASNAGVVTPNDAKTCAHTPRNVARVYAGTQDVDHRRQAGGRDLGRGAHPVDTLGIGPRPQFA